MLNRPITNAETPCEDCYLTRMQAGPGFADGFQATINSGQWLHHMVMLDQGTGKNDAICSWTHPPRTMDGATWTTATVWNPSRP